MKILIVDDEMVSITKLNLLLSEYGQCDSAENGTEAMEKFYRAHDDSEPYSLIALDIDLPDMTGLDILEQIRKWELQHNAHAENREAKILMVTAKSDTKNILASFKKGCEGYLTKPFDATKLNKSLAKLGISGKRGHMK